MSISFVDSIGVVVVLSAATLPLGCLPTPAVRGDLQPFVAVAGAYALADRDEPVPPAGACSTCGAPVPPGGGTLGDGTVKVPCPECNDEAKEEPKECDCGCNGRGYIIRKDGTRWACKCPPDCSCKCKDGKCTMPPTAR